MTEIIGLQAIDTRKEVLFHFAASQDKISLDHSISRSLIARSLDQLLTLSPRYVKVSCLTYGDGVGGRGR